MGRAFHSADGPRGVTVRTSYIDGSTEVYATPNMSDSEVDRHVRDRFVPPGSYLAEIGGTKDAPVYRYQLDPEDPDDLPERPS